MASKLDKLLSIRTRILGDFDHHIDEAKKFNADSDKQLVTFRTIALEKTYKEFVDICDELEKNSAYHELENMEAIITKNRDVQDKYLNIKITLSPFLEGENAGLNSTFFENARHVRSFIDLTSENMEGHTSQNQQMGIKLANIHVTPFDGKYEAWTEFKDSFQSIMKKYRGDNVEKFTHLKNYLRGEAKDLVRHLSIDNESYAIAWEMLATQFENKNAIIESHIESIMNLPPINGTAHTSIRAAVTATKTCLAAIKNLQIMVDTWDPIVVLLLKKKLDPELLGKWEEERKGSFEPIKLKDFLSFLDTRHKIAAAMPRNFFQKPQNTDQRFKIAKNLLSVDKTPVEADPMGSEYAPSEVKMDEDDVDAHMLYNRKDEICGICGDHHRVFMCPRLKENSREALELIKQNQLCTNCLYKHEMKNCSSKFNCKICAQRHHTALHEILTTEGVAMVNTNHIFLIQPITVRALLATALIPVRTPDGQTEILRALLDQGSTANLITERGAQLLKCKRTRVMGVPMFGVGNVQTGTSVSKATLVLGSLYDKTFQLPISAYVTPFITSIPPITKELMAKWEYLTGLCFADPSETNSQEIDVLLGATTFAQLIEPGLLKGKMHEPIAQNTKLGWITSGTCENVDRIHTLICHAQESEHYNILTNEDLSQQMKLFWEVEDVATKKEWSEEEKKCDEFFTRTISRAPDGKFIMRIPFNEDPAMPGFLGESYENAKKRFFQLERRFARNTQLKNEYAKGIHEYLTLGHAVRIPLNQVCHVIPHHAVFKEDSTTTKLRTVYDASAKTTNGYSLNDRMHIGPTILEELWAVLMRWRLGKYAVIADIEKMYRQFWVHPGDAKYLQILWRDEPNLPLELLELKTVTFGTASAPYMAIKGLHLIAKALEQKQPEIALSLINCFYVDDYLESFDTIEEALQRKQGLAEGLSAYGLNLRKWQANAEGLIAETLVDVKISPQDAGCKVLGLQWDTKTDELSYKVDYNKDTVPFTKRKVLSEMLSLFDPLGLLAPIIMRAKTFMQQLWLGTFGWDDELPADLLTEWKKIKASLTRCSNFRVPRWVSYTKDNKHVSLHGFGDASEKMYAAAAYLRTVDREGHVEVHLLTAKTKVSPLKKLSIPHLELCAAVLVAELIKKLHDTLKIPNVDTYAWTDSGVVLAWISTPSYKLKTFVSNRVAKIQELIPAEKWRYVSTSLNPADYATRVGNELVALTKWWTGPPFLLNEPQDWPKIPDHMVSKTKLPDMKKKVMTQQMGAPPEDSPFILNYSSLQHLVRVTAYCVRWLKKYKHLHTQTSITTVELLNAKKIWIKQVQSSHFSVEIELVQKGKNLPAKHHLLSLNPFLDEDGILRVRGRTERSLLKFETKHPAFLPTKSRLTQLWIKDAHFRALHGGVQLTLRTLRDEVWINKSKELVKAQCNRCITCYRTRGKPAQQQMADLLAPQVQPNRPFSHTGVDFAGHFMVKTSNRRNAGFVKCYVSLFICLTTKAIHLELAENLSTKAFLGALSRFIARRGIPTEMYSDRGTNFCGAAKELPYLWYDTSSGESQTIQKEFATQGIIWHFNPARASHFGGLWEAGVKSMKTHLYRVLKDTKLNYEDFNTLLTQIEACLNSRPLCPLSEDINDFEVLTPGHFLMGQAPITLPYPDPKPINMKVCKRYEFIQNLYKSFWDQWSHEYLTRLQRRPKWKLQHPNLEIGQIVLIKEDDQPPTAWVLGRIVQIFQGNDGLVRSAMVRLNRKTTVSRPIHKLCLLPIEDNDKCANDERLMIDQSLIGGENVDAL